MVWTQEEVESYHQADNLALTSLYSSAGIGKSPEKRAKYLAESFLGLTMSDHEMIMRKAGEEGRPAALRLLEDIAISKLGNVRIN